MNISKQAKLVSILASGVLTAGVLNLSAATAFASSSLAGGDFMEVANVTQASGWQNQVNANPGDIVEYKIHIQNDGDQPAERVQMWGVVGGQIAITDSTSLTITSEIADYSNGGKDLKDSTTVNVVGGTSQSLRSVPGHAYINGNTSNYPNCANGCQLDDSQAIGGFVVGDIAPHDFAEVTFKATVTNVPAPTATAAPTTAPTAVPTATAAPTQTQEQTQNNNQTVTINNTNTVNPAPSATPQVVTVASTADVKQLPNTGLPIAAWGLGGLIPLGIKFRKFAGQAKDIVTPSFLWEKRNQA